MLDAYTVRKAVPRILLAVIGINLSIYLCVAALDITSIVGRGIGQLLNEAFIPSGEINVSGELLELNTTSGVATGGALTIIVTKLFLLPGSPGLTAVIASLFPLLLIVGLIALAVFFTLVIRQGLLIFLTVLSPVAIACFILPGTEKYFQKWLDLFIKTLMTYPIIAIIFAMSNVMASIVLGDASATTAALLNPATIINSPLFAQATASDSDVVSLLKLFTGIIVIYAPLALIPFSFKLAGGAIGAVFNAAQGTSASRRAGYQKSRAGKLDQARADRATKFDRGGFRNRGLGRLQNRIGRGMAAGARNRYGFTERGRAAMGQAAGANVNETLKSNPRLYELRNNDDANNLLALSGGNEAGLGQAARDLFTDETGVYDNVRAERAMSAARAAGVTRENAAAALTTSAQNKWRAVGAGRADIVQSGINRLAGNNEQEARGMAYGNQYFSRESGRADLGGNYMDVSTQAITDYATQHNLTNPDGSLDLVTSRNHLSAIDGMGRTEVPKMLQGHPGQVGQQLAVARQLLEHGTDEQRIIGATRLLEFQKNINYASGESQALINQTLADVGVDLGHPEAIDDQLEVLGGLTINSQELSRRARVYDREQTTNPATVGGGGPAGGGPAGGGPAGGGPAGGGPGGGP